jgi:hypothetical protein
LPSLQNALTKGKVEKLKNRFLIKKFFLECFVTKTRLHLKNQHKVLDFLVAYPSTAHSFIKLEHYLLHLKKKLHATHHQTETLSIPSSLNEPSTAPSSKRIINKLNNCHSTIKLIQHL